jgi:transcription antitermination factor NusG
MMPMLWYALRSKPNKEMSLWREVCARGLECYYPQLQVRPVNPRSRHILPYFPGYMFVRADLEKVGVSTFQWMPFGLGLVSFGGEPAQVPDDLVQAIRRRTDQLKEAGGEGSLKPGDVLVIQEGPFEGYQALFDAYLPGDERVRVFLNLLKDQQMKVVLSARQVERKIQG